MRMGGWLGRFLCRIGWHQVMATEYAGSPVERGRCARCGCTGLIDSQGNLF